MQSLQMNFQLTAQFEKDLFDVMNGLETKCRSKAVREAVHLLAQVFRDRAKASPPPTGPRCASSQ
jgi:hypothetical protein